ncbi:M23 family metallopeptidase [Sanguibacter sp. 25GB23B1]|uniref:M23 family metallopeptidase n=1 Tax=unclassified Sanguibacter TaxID=2645534 RepID=UPI0032AFBA44
MTSLRRSARPARSVLLVLAFSGILAAGVPVPPAGARPVSVQPEHHLVPSGGSTVGATRAELRSSGVLVREFDPPTARWGPGHRGVDLRSANEAPVLAPQAGTVAFVGVVVDRPLVVISHADGLRSTLEPVASDLTTGTAVARGDVVGVLAPGVATHCAPATCLHWGVRRGEEYIDPLTLVVENEAVILLPLVPR